LLREKYSALRKTILIDRETDRDVARVGLPPLEALEDGEITETVPERVLLGA
jgi:hypothetical protein